MISPTRPATILEQVKFYKGGFLGSDELLVLRMICLFDPQGPIRFKDRSCAITGINTMLAFDMVESGKKQTILEIIGREIYGHWLRNQTTGINLTTKLETELARYRVLLSNTKIGFGAERCLYEANEGFGCQSPYVIKDNVVVIEDLLSALDRAAASADMKTKPMDRHIAAFIAARFDQDVQAHLRALASGKESTAIIGMLSLLAFLQFRTRRVKLLGLTSWVGGLLAPAINSYHNRATRQKIEKEIPLLVRKGSLPEIFELIDNVQMRKQDQDGFDAARIEYATANKEIQDIQGADGTMKERIEKSGRQAVAMFSVIASMFGGVLMFIGQFF